MSIEVSYETYSRVTRDATMTWVPFDLEKITEECPFRSLLEEQKRGDSIGMVSPQGIVSTEVQLGDARYCWENCRVVDCPVYKENN